MEKYEINEETMAVIGVDYGTTKVIEKEGEYVLKDKAFEVMDYSCNYFGSSYYGRVDGSKKMIQANYKLPIIVEESSELIFFPTTSPEYDNCIWVSLKGYDYVESSDNITLIHLKNGQVIETTTSISSIKNQVLRASRLNQVLNERKVR